MPENKQKLFEEKLKQMQAHFINGLPQKLIDIQQAWEMAQQPDSRKEGVTLLHRLVHTLTGSAGTFALNTLSVQARELELVLKEVSENLHFLDAAKTQQINALLEIIKTEIAQSATHEPKALLNSNHSQDIETKEKNRVLLIEDDELLSDYLAAQLRHFGYEVQSVFKLDQVQVALQKQMPDLIILDISFPEGSLAGIEKINELQSLIKPDMPLLFISSRQDIIARLNAVRAHGRAYFVKPVNISILIEKVHELTEHEKVEPYHILVVDDDPAMIELITTILNQAGMDANGITNPLTILETVSETNPDLILLDLHMPECSGIELAQVIRQHHNLANIPIIFLSAETDRRLQLETALQGGDDFLQKPIRVNEIALFIKTRAKRARELKTLMIKDGLTGLFNHSYTKELIDREMERVLRTHSVLSVAMLDIDFFKQVNDTHGHMVGDQVLRSLSYYLNKRLRKTDLVGRYGGEEFVVVMPDTPAEEALKVMQTILEDFGSVVHHAPDKDFNVTFSAGVISSDYTKDSTLMMQYVDEALYNAKHQGRNRVVLA